MSTIPLTSLIPYPANAFTMSPTAPAATMTIGSGAFLSFSSTRKVATPITAVGTSMMDRLARTNAAPPIAPAAAAVTPETKAFTRRSLDQRRTLGAKNMTTANGGRNTPAAEMTAPSGPDTRYPMNATVMTTGPGVIIATATASRNWRSFSQWKLSTTPPCRNGTIARPLPNTKAPASVKYQAIRHNSPGAGPPIPATSQPNQGPSDNAVVF